MLGSCLDVDLYSQGQGRGNSQGRGTGDGETARDEGQGTGDEGTALCDLCPIFRFNSQGFKPLAIEEYEPLVSNPKNEIY